MRNRLLVAAGPLQQGARPLQAGGIGAEQRLGLQAGIWHRGRQLGEHFHRERRGVGS